MNQAIGLVEVKGLASAIQTADVMVKVAAVELLGVQKAKGFGWMTVEVAGDVGAVKAAVDAAKASAMAEGSFVSALVIPRPANSLDTVMLNAVDFPQAQKTTAVTPENAVEKAVSHPEEKTADEPIVVATEKAATEAKTELPVEEKETSADAVTESTGEKNEIAERPVNLPAETTDTKKPVKPTGKKAPAKKATKKKNDKKKP